MPTTSEFTDPRLVAIYDTVNAYAPDTQPRFYCHLAAEVGAKSIVDLGCGTGLITRALAEQGHRVIGIDPASAMVDRARGKPYGDRVRWIVGGAGQLGSPDCDLAIMSGHVVQFFLTDQSWHEALTGLHRALRPGGWLAFESRNPAAREWEHWTREANRLVSDPTGGRIEIWSEVHDVTDGIVSYAIHYRFESTGEEIVSPTRLRFRSAEELTQSLTDAGFVVRRVDGGWDGEPSGPMSRELVFVASR